MTRFKYVYWCTSHQQYVKPSARRKLSDQQRCKIVRLNLTLLRQVDFRMFSTWINSDHSSPSFAGRLAKYLYEISRAGSEAGRAFHFLEFVRGVYKEVDMEYLERLHPDLERHIKLKNKTLMVRGRVDAFLGNLIIEFE